MPRIFPEPGIKNVMICVCGTGAQKDFSTLMMDVLSNLDVLHHGQCFPLYTYEQVDDQSRNRKVALLDSQSPDCGSDGVRVGDYIRRENISDAMLRKFRERYESRELCSRNTGDTVAGSLTKEDIFYYVYGILHSESYKNRFAPDLKKQLPRIPLVSGVNLFRQFSEAGRALAALHLNYETGAMYPLEEVVLAGGLVPSSYHVTKMRFPSKTDKSMI